MEKAIEIIKKEIKSIDECIKHQQNMVKDNQAWPLVQSAGEAIARYQNEKLILWCLIETLQDEMQK